MYILRRDCRRYRQERDCKRGIQGETVRDTEDRLHELHTDEKLRSYTHILRADTAYDTHRGETA